MNEKDKIIKGGYLVEVVGHDGNKVLWEVVEDNVVEEATDHNEIGLQGFDFILFNRDEKGVGKEGSSEFPYVLMLSKIFPGDSKTQLNSTNQKVD